EHGAQAIAMAFLASGVALVELEGFAQRRQRAEEIALVHPLGSCGDVHEHKLAAACFGAYGRAVGENQRSNGDGAPQNDHCRDQAGQQAVYETPSDESFSGAGAASEDGPVLDETPEVFGERTGRLIAELRVASDRLVDDGLKIDRSGRCERAQTRRLFLRDL